MDISGLPLTSDQPRSVVLEGTTNLRDLGGWRAVDGRRVRFGLVYRSSSLAHLTEEDGAVLSDLGLRTVCDLRGEHEAARAPSRLPPGIGRVPLPIDPQVGASLRDMLARGVTTGEDVVGLLRRAYLSYATTWLPVYRELFNLLLEPTRRPLLFHCSAGKDRTGFGAALLLTALGVDRETVLQDYAATDRLWRRREVLPKGTPEPITDALLRTHSDLLEEALAAAVAPYGSEAGLLTEGLGLDAFRLQALRDILLE